MDKPVRSMRNPNPAVVDYGELIGLIPQNPRFSPSDVDGICERNGHFLIMEWKRPGEQASGGQKILLKALAANPKFVVIVVIGHTDDNMYVQEFYQYTPNGKAYLAGTGVNSFKEFYKQWYEYADGQK